MERNFCDWCGKNVSGPAEHSVQNCSGSMEWEQWLDELDEMRARMRRVRERLAAADNEVPGLNLAALGEQNGLFAMLPLTKEQIVRMREDHGVYMAGSGRINVAGLHAGNTDKFIAALADVTAG